VNSKIDQKDGLNLLYRLAWGPTRVNLKNKKNSFLRKISKKQYFSKKNDVFDLNKENVNIFDEKLLFRSKNLMKPGSELEG
jgi:hypothetical protein